MRKRPSTRDRQCGSRRVKLAPLHQPPSRPLALCRGRARTGQVASDVGVVLPVIPALCNLPFRHGSGGRLCQMHDIVPALVVELHRRPPGRVDVDRDGARGGRWILNLVDAKVVVDIRVGAGRQRPRCPLTHRRLAAMSRDLVVRGLDQAPPQHFHEAVRAHATVHVRVSVHRRRSACVPAQHHGLKAIALQHAVASVPTLLPRAVPLERLHECGRVGLLQTVGGRVLRRHLGRPGKGGSQRGRQLLPLAPSWRRRLLLKGAGPILGVIARVPAHDLARDDGLEFFGAPLADHHAVGRHHRLTAHIDKPVQGLRSTVSGLRLTAAGDGRGRGPASIEAAGGEVLCERLCVPGSPLLLDCRLEFGQLLRADCRLAGGSLLPSVRRRRGTQHARAAQAARAIDADRQRPAGQQHAARDGCRAQHWH
mmetsp:Transcript_13368/g.42047  ORF Transcript_13368/g.42047 Transcript_13368/m.42047 type:complete len:424 (+) Transcript_13368:211-1482(+)